MENVILAHCALKPGVVEGAACEKADDSCAIRGSEKYLKVACTEVLITLPLPIALAVDLAVHCTCQSNSKYHGVMCQGCNINYHYGCWRAFERIHKVEYPDFSWKVCFVV